MWKFTRKNNDGFLHGGCDCFLAKSISKLGYYQKFFLFVIIQNKTKIKNVFVFNEANRIKKREFLIKNFCNVFVKVIL